MTSPIPSATDVLTGVDLTGRRVVVTGAATGTGRTVAHALAAAGAEVTLAVRDADAGGAARDGIVAGTGNDAVRVGEVDLADQHSIARFVRLWDGPLHVLVHAAGVAGPPHARTVDGWELHRAVTHLGPAALSAGLHWALAAVDGARIVTVLPAPEAALHAAETARRWAGDGIAVNSVRPGAAPGAVAATAVLLAGSPLVAGIGGRAFADLAETGPIDGADPATARREWERTGRTLRAVWLPAPPAAA